MEEVKQLLWDIDNTDISDRLRGLILQVYMDAEYRERANSQLKDMVITLENRNAALSKNGHHLNGDGHHRRREEVIAMRKYAKMLQEADSEKVSLANEVADLSRANYELQVQLNAHLQNP